MAFRANYLVKVFVEVLWLVLMIIFYNTLFDKTDAIAGWNKYQYFFFLGCFYALEGLMETFFLSNFGEFAEMVRTGKLDLVLVQPVDEQFMISFKSIEWSTVPNVVMGLGMMSYSVLNLGIGFEPDRIAGFLIGMSCGVVIAYSFMLMLASTSVWLVRNQSLYEVWWLFTSLMRYPREIYETTMWAFYIGRFFTFAVPALLAINVPAASMVKELDRGLLLYAVGSAIVLSWLSRRVFRRALQSYRSASS
jgi:ABC-2 type transport system permease protein